MIKRLFCKHNWRAVRWQNVWTDGTYGCTKCSKVEDVKYYDDKVWRFRRGMKGDTFE